MQTLPGWCSPTLIIVGLILVVTGGSLTFLIGVPLRELREHPAMSLYLDAREAQAYLTLVQLRERGHFLLADRLEAWLEAWLDADAEVRAQRRQSLVDTGAGGRPDLAQRLRVAYGLT